MYLFHNPNHLILSMAGVGIAWAAILSLPFAILSSALPASKMGVYLGIFNFTIAGPQILSGLLGGPILKNIFSEHAIFILVLAGLSMLLGSISVFFVKDKPYVAQ
jgi:maltose/moltooligosaccharide transporter